MVEHPADNNLIEMFAGASAEDPNEAPDRQRRGSVNSIFELPRLRLTPKKCSIFTSDSANVRVVTMVRAKHKNTQMITYPLG